MRVGHIDLVIPRIPFATCQDKMALHARYCQCSHKDDWPAQQSQSQAHFRFLANPKRMEKGPKHSLVRCGSWSQTEPPPLFPSVLLLLSDPFLSALFGDWIGGLGKVLAEPVDVQKQDDLWQILSAEVSLWCRPSIKHPSKVNADWNGVSQYGCPLKWLISCGFQLNPNETGVQASFFEMSP